MRDYTIRTTDQLKSLIRSFRDRAQAGQHEVAIKLGTSQQNISRLEREPGSMSLERFIRLLSALDIDLVLRDRRADTGQIRTSRETKKAEW